MGGFELSKELEVFLHAEIGLFVVRFFEADHEDEDEGVEHVDYSDYFEEAEVVREEVSDYMIFRRCIRMINTNLMETDDDSKDKNPFLRVFALFLDEYNQDEEVNEVKWNRLHFSHIHLIVFQVLVNFSELIILNSLEIIEKVRISMCLKRLHSNSLIQLTQPD